jgi:hypothetical protein
MNALQKLLVGTAPPDRTAPRITRLRWIRRAGYVRLAPLEILVLVLLAVYVNLYLAAALAGFWLVCIADISRRIRREQGKPD